MDFYWPNAECTAELYADYTMGPDRGIVQAYLDGAAIGEPVNQYIYGKHSVPADHIYLGRTTLSPGRHTLTFEVIGKEPESSGYKIGLHHAVRIRIGG